jgi:hypothetical protein
LRQDIGQRAAAFYRFAACVMEAVLLFTIPALTIARRYD